MNIYQEHPSQSGYLYNRKAFFAPVFNSVVAFFILCLLSGLGQAKTDPIQKTNYSYIKDVAYNFTDISDTGAVILEKCDDCAIAVTLDFEFTYFGRTYNQLYVTSNGFILPGGSILHLLNSPFDRTACCHGREIPFQDFKELNIVISPPIAGVIAPYWVDLSMKKRADSNADEQNGKVFLETRGKKAGSRVLIIQYDQVRHFHNLASEKANTFQVKIFEEDNHIEFHYKNVVMNENVHSIGIESPNQREGRQFYRGSDLEDLPESGKKFAVGFRPPKGLKLTSSTRFAGEGTILRHEFEIDNKDISGLEFDTRFGQNSLLVERSREYSFKPDESNPSKFSLKYELLDSLPTESNPSGLIGVDKVKFEMDDAELLLESQTVYVSTEKFYDKAGIKISDLIFNKYGSLSAFKSADGILANNDQSDEAEVYFRGKAQGQNNAQDFKLSSESGVDKCGAPFLDDTTDKNYLYVLCETGKKDDQVKLYRYYLDKYLDDSLGGKKEKEIDGTQHIFTGNLEKYGLVVAGGDSVAYARGVDGMKNIQEIYFNGDLISGQGQVTSLAIDEKGKQLVYVMDSKLFYHSNKVNNKELDDNSGKADISGDGSLIVFSSATADLDLSVDNTDGSSEIFTMDASTIDFPEFTQKTDLGKNGVCKLPKANYGGERIVFVCNRDLLAVGNEFKVKDEVSDENVDIRESVFVIDNIAGRESTHLINSTKSNRQTDNISQLSLSSDGAIVAFEDGNKNNTFLLRGLSRLFNEVEPTLNKQFPEAYELPGDGKNGSMFSILFILLACTSLRLQRKRVPF